MDYGDHNSLGTVGSFGLMSSSSSSAAYRDHGDTVYPHTGSNIGISSSSSSASGSSSSNGGPHKGLQHLQAKAAARTRKEATHELTGIPTMTQERIKLACMEHQGYETPELNDRLYLHYNGFRAIQNLEPYRNLKALWLDSNGITIIENLQHLHDLRCLYLQSNLIERIQNLQGLEMLQTLNLASNHITLVENLACLPRLQTLNLSKNSISDHTSLQHLKDCPMLNNLDISDNLLTGDVGTNDGIASLLNQIPKLVTVYLKGNPCVRETRNYRKTMVSTMPNLRYLDDRPIFEAERLATNAWATGGQEAELQARRDYEDKEKERSRLNMERFKQWQEEVRLRRSKELEQINKERKEAGESELTELPRKSYVSYSRVTTKYQTETMRLQRLAEKAEALAKAEGYHETAMMDLGRQWWQEEGILDSEGNLVKRHEEGDGTEAAAHMTERDEEDEQRHVEEIATRQEREEHAKERGDTVRSESDDGLGAVMLPSIGNERTNGDAADSTATTAVTVPVIDKEAEEAKARINRSLQMFKERYNSETSKPNTTVNGESTEESSSVPETMNSSTTVSLMERIAEAKREAQQDVRTLPSSHNATVSSLPPWTTTLDAALLKFVPQADFDFEKVARALKSALLRGKLTVPTENGNDASSSSTLQTIAESMTSETCRLRYTVLTTPAITSTESIEGMSPNDNVTESTAPSATTVTVTNEGSVHTGTDTNVRYQVKAGTGVGLRAPQVVTSNNIPNPHPTKSYASWIPTTSKKDYAAAATTAALLAEAVNTTVYDGQENHQYNQHHLPIKPLSELIQGEFSLDHFRDYVRPSTELPSIVQDNRQKYSHILHHPTAPETNDGDDDDDDDDDDEEPVTREDILRSLRGQAGGKVKKSNEDKDTKIKNSSSNIHDTQQRYRGIEETKSNDTTETVRGSNTSYGDEEDGLAHTTSSRNTSNSNVRTTVTNVDDLD